MSNAAISSTANPRIKRVRALQSSRNEREGIGRFVIEGPTLIDEALAAGIIPDEIYYSEDFTADPAHAPLMTRLVSSGAQGVSVTADVLHHMSDTRAPQGILAVLPFVNVPVPDAPSFLLILDSIRDPGNLGTIMRLAAGAAVPLILLVPGTVDPYNPKVVRSAMGAHFLVPFTPAGWDAVQSVCEARPVFVADSAGGTPYFHADWRQPCALIVSDEAHGPGPEALSVATHTVTIPMPGKTESLNVAMATGILVFEMLRQRMEAG